MSFLATHDIHGFVPGINDLIEGREITAAGDTVKTVSYAERIAMGKQAHEALREFDRAMTAGDEAAMESARADLKDSSPYFGYGYLDSVDEAVPPVGMTFYSFHIMVIFGSYLLLFILVALYAVYRRPLWWNSKLLLWVSILSVAVVWILSLIHI